MIDYPPYSVEPQNIEGNDTAAQKRFADIGRLLTGDAGGEDIFYRETQILMTLAES